MRRLQASFYFGQKYLEKLCLSVWQECVGKNKSYHSEKINIHWVMVKALFIIFFGKYYEFLTYEN